MGQVEAENLKFWADKIVNDPALEPVFKTIDGEQVVDKTFCNIGVNRICTGMNYDKFAGLVANQIYDYCAKNWITPYGNDRERARAAHTAASLGDLAIAAEKGKPHGHVAVVYPDRDMVFSGRWQFYVPRLANVGKKNAIMGANYCFINIPDFFILGRTVV